MTISRLFTSGCCVAALFCSSVVKAQDTPSAGGDIETVVVTAQKRTEDIQSVPITVQAFTAKAVQDLGIKSTADLSQFTSNVTIALPAGEGNQPIISIRGVGLNDYDSNNAGPNGVYMDEVYMSSPSSQTFQAFDLGRIEVLKGPQGTLYGRNTSGGAINFISVKPTDYYTGDFHVEYGSFNTYQIQGAVGGPIADGLDARIAVVKNGSSGYVYNALTGGHENGVNNVAGRVQVNWRPIENLSLLLNVHGGSVANRPSEYRHLAALDPNSGGLCSVSDARSGTGGCIDIFGYGTPSKFYSGAYNRRQHLKVHNWGGSLRADYTLGSLDFISLTAFEHNDKIDPDETDASPNRLLEIDGGVNSKTFTQEFRVSQSTDTYNWLVGLYYLGETLRQNQPIYLLLDADNFFGVGAGSLPEVGAQIDYDNSRQVTNSYAIFGQGDYKLTDKLKLTLGARFTGESKSFQYAAGVQYQVGGINELGPVLPILPLPGDSFNRKLSNTSFNWKAALDYQLTDDVMPYASVSTGFKSGGFNGSFLATPASPDFIAVAAAQISAQLQPIKPERITAYEVGVKSTFFDNRLLFNAALFYNDYHDLQVFILAPVSSPIPGGQNLYTNILTNTKNAHMEGADLQIVGKPIEDFTLSAQIGILQAKVDSVDSTPAQPNGYHGHQMPLAPHLSMSLAADYIVHLDTGHLEIQFNANYKSHQYYDLANNPYLTEAPYWIENARVAYSFDDDQWEVAAYIRNLSGQHYYIDMFDLSYVGLYEGVRGQPRTIGAEMNYHF
ncbi:MAG: TonB-dependent receptor [Alphaproteobacteria bacterium]|nr:TonB-dependent receptor [Alphaproteobacteria bacterium]